MLLQIVSSKVDKVKEKLGFAVSSMSEFASELGEYGLETAEADKKPVAAIRDEQHRKYVMKDEFNLENVEKFIEDYLGGKLEPFLKSEAIPDDK